jgi:capsular exopolysaccharide synthesis family protein
MGKYVEQAESNLLKKCLNKWYLFVLSGAIAFATAWYLLASEPLVWAVVGSVIVEEEKNGGSQLPDEAIIQGLPFKNSGTLDKQIQVLKSRNLMEKVVDSLGIDLLYFVERRFVDQELYKNSPLKVTYMDKKEDFTGEKMRMKQIDETRFAILPTEDEDTLYYNYGVQFTYKNVNFIVERDTQFPLEEDPIFISRLEPLMVASYYASRLNLQKMAQSNVLAISMNDMTPQKVKDIMHVLIDVYNVEAQHEKNRVASQQLDFIEERLSYLSSQLAGVESTEAAIRSSSEVTTDIDASAQRYYEQLSTVEQTRGEISSTRSSLQSLQAFLSDRGNQFELIPNFGDLGGKSFIPLVSQYNKMIVERERLLETFTPAYPGVMEHNEKINKVRSTILSTINLALTDLERQENQLVAKVNPVQRNLRSLPSIEKRLREVGRQGAGKNEVLVLLLQKREETAIGLAAQVQAARILDEPVRMKKPVGPNSGQYYALAMLLGLGLPVSVLYILDRLNDKVQSKAEIKAWSKAPFLGEVAYAKSERSKLITASSRSVIAEMFRLIRTNLQFLTAASKEKVILVTSNMSGDGKTFISGNLAACLALTDKKTVILELDLRKPKLTEFLLNMPPTVGITNYLVGEKEIEDILQPVEGYDGLFLMSSGPTPPNPAELILGERMKELIEYLKKNFDYVVLDTPPAGLVTDAFLLSKYAACTIFVVRSGKTKKDELGNIQELCKEGKLVNPALILNGTKMPKRYGYYY